jgi:hypothetical protein
MALVVVFADVKTTKESPACKYIHLDRSQLEWEVLDLERLIGADHAARIIWEVAGGLPLSKFEEGQKSLAGSAGRPCWPARLLVSIWVYGYSMGVASARALERMMSHEPGLRWLAANQTVNHHTLADFRVGHATALEQLFIVAGSGSFHRKTTLQARLNKARKVVRELDRRAAEEPESMERQREAAQRRAGKEAVERAQAALAQIQRLEASTPAREHAGLRASSSEAETRKMKQGDGGIGPSYNVQVSTEPRSRMIVGIGLTTAANDTQELMASLERAERNSGHKPARVIADGGYATRSNVEQTTAQGIALIAPWKDDASRGAGAQALHGIDPDFAPSVFRAHRGGKTLQCPAGKTLVMIERKIHHGLPQDVFQAKPSDCRRCRLRQSCCGNRGGPRRVERVVESPAMKQYLARMKQPATKALYRTRAEIAEFPHLWAKAMKKWRRFSVRGLVKAGMEALWVALAYNLTQWIRIRPTVVPTA